MVSNHIDAKQHTMAGSCVVKTMFRPIEANQSSMGVFGRVLKSNLHDEARL